MNNPFARIRPPEEPEQSVSPVRLTCLECGNVVMRAEYAPYDWYHEDEEISLATQRSNYNHRARPDYIDTTTVEGMKQ